MARNTIVQLSDDLDGGEAEESIAFSFRGTEYEIDLSSKNAAALEKALGKYLDAARRIPKTRSPGRRSGAGAAGKEDVGAIRVWARENGYDVSDRGRIPAEIREAYEAAG